MRGFAGNLDNPIQVLEVHLSSDDQWVFGWEDDGKLTLVSAGACGRCRVIRDRLIRCATHRSCKFVARQLVLV